jgi:hypothetical protein
MRRPGVIANINDVDPLLALINTLSSIEWHNSNKDLILVFRFPQ